jgi:flagellar export protein FliJ
MNKATRLEPLAEFADLKQNEAARRVAASAEALRRKEAELEQLRSYLAEYRRRADLEQAATGSALWRNSRAFLARLSDAVAFHEAEAGKLTERYRLESERWRASHQHAKALDKVIERSVLDERQARARRDQAEVDEVAARYHRQRR